MSNSQSLDWQTAFIMYKMSCGDQLHEWLNTYTSVWIVQHKISKYSACNLKHPLNTDLHVVCVYLVVQPGVQYAYYHPVHSHKLSQQQEETGRHYPLKSIDINVCDWRLLVTWCVKLYWKSLFYMFYYSNAYKIHHKRSKIEKNTQHLQQ